MIMVITMRFEEAKERKKKIINLSNLMMMMQKFHANGVDE